MSDDEDIVEDVAEAAPASNKKGGAPIPLKPKEIQHDESGKVILSVKLRDYSKSLFLYPLLIYSIVAILIEGIWDQWLSPGDPALATLGGPHSSIMIIWIIVFFANLFVVSFDFSTIKFLLLIVVVALVIAILIVLYSYGMFDITKAGVGAEANHLKIGAGWQFYAAVSIVLGFVFVCVLIQAEFQYVKVEQNEAHVKGILGEDRRYPTNSLRYTKKITDVFEYLALRSGEISIVVPGEEHPIKLETVINVNKKAKQLDVLLSTTRTQITT
ncbi:MAG TPA: hypothetical protein VKK79_11645 [Candidatus Lokiarchaeia archaeon]|nr:hypothetical protein [Candidatus Lokiarchaeia archaeon]